MLLHRTKDRSGGELLDEFELCHSPGRRCEYTIFACNKDKTYRRQREAKEAAAGKGNEITLDLVEVEI